MSSKAQKSHVTCKRDAEEKKIVAVQHETIFQTEKNVKEIKIFVEYAMRSVEGHNSYRNEHLRVVVRHLFFNLQW